MPDLAFDELSQWPLPQLRHVAFSDVERRCDHLARGSVHADKMYEAREVLQVREINRVKINTLRITVRHISKKLLGVCMLLKYACTSRIIPIHTDNTES